MSSPHDPGAVLVTPGARLPGYSPDKKGEGEGEEEEVLEGGDGGRNK